MGSIVVGVDGSPSSERALEWALRSGTLHGHRPVEAVLVFQPPAPIGGMLPEPGAYPELEAQLLAAAEAQLAGVVARVPDPPPASARVMDGPVAPTLLDAAGDSGELVVGCRGRGGFARLLLGSVSHQVVMHAGVDVTVVRGWDGEPPAGGRVVVGVDGSPGSATALNRAAEEARLRGARLHVLHAWRMTTDPAPADAEGQGYVASVAQYAAAARARADGLVADVLGGDADPAPTVEVVHRSSAAALLDASRDAELLVVGRRGTGGFAGLLLGSTSAQLVRHAHCPVLVVPRRGER
jgi:nucleotide-binding universal stress UspA family protein